jgi:hypothetical protein
MFSMVIGSPGSVTHRASRESLLVIPSEARDLLSVFLESRSFVASLLRMTGGVLRP